MTLRICLASTRRGAKFAGIASILVSVLLVSATTAENRRQDGGQLTPACGGLHAAIRVQVVRREPPDTQAPFVMLSFILLNDGNAPINSVEGGWQIVIDGKELPDSDFIFGNGVVPAGGWGVLQPGESYEFGKGLDLSKYFREEREYKVSWKGKGFQSSTIAVAVTPPNEAATPHDSSSK